MSGIMHHDMFRTFHGTRLINKKRKQYLFELVDGGQPAVVAVGEDRSTCKLFYRAAASLN